MTHLHGTTAMPPSTGWRKITYEQPVADLLPGYYAHIIREGSGVYLVALRTKGAPVVKLPDAGVRQLARIPNGFTPSVSAGTAYEQMWITGATFIAGDEKMMGAPLLVSSEYGIPMRGGFDVWLKCRLSNSEPVGSMVWHTSDPLPAVSALPGIQVTPPNYT